ncbi:hypothetical protein C450_20666 [Halococcus salifodinae DSM 8989]|uniref:Uncharacterized protein n=2 Tax=Halococcus salifodinae TaxID=36738 RepID=M0MTG4_9EURY|nr:hypothetical protein C450_20666 [Halococcus salifodinae DSM 8989]
MALMRDVPVEVSEMANLFDVTEKTARNLFDRLESHKILLPSPDGARLTGYGHMIAREQQRALDELTTRTLSKFAASDTLSAILRALQEGPLRKSELSETCNISRRTRRDMCDSLIQEDWIAYEAGQYKLLSLGETKLSIYKGFEEAIELISSRKDFVLRLEDLAQEFPTAALRETRMATGEFGSPHAVLTLLEDQTDLDVDSLRGIQQVYSPQLIDAYDPLVPKGKEIELIIDQTVYRKATKITNLHHLKRAGKFANFRMQIYPESISFGLGMFGDKKVLVGAYSEHEPYNAAILGSNDELMDWTTQKYEEVRQESQTPSERFWDWLL